MTKRFLERFKMKYIRYEVNNGQKNMQIDSDLLDEAIEKQSTSPIFRLYGWSPKCISLGRNQKEFTLNENIDCVRRLTGGRALLHDKEITYSYITPMQDEESVIESYKRISGILINFFKTISIDLDFGENKRISTQHDYCMLLSTGADVCYQGKKLIGSAQCRKNGYILQHGSILYDYDKEYLEKLFNEEVKGITCIKEIMPDITFDNLLKKLEIYIENLNI